MFFLLIGNECVIFGRVFFIHFCVLCGHLVGKNYEFVEKEFKKKKTAVVFYRDN